MTVRELYEQTIKPLAPADRLQLATFILNDIPPQSVVDYSEEWSDEDIRDFTRATWMHMDKELDEAKDG